MSGGGPSAAALAARFRPVFDKIAGTAVERETERRLPFEEVAWLREAGFTAVTVPTALGGGGAGPRELFALLIELGEADSNLPQLLRAHFTAVESWLLAEHEPDSQRWLRRVAEGAVIGNASHERSKAAVGTLSTRVRQIEGRLLLEGVKHYSTGAMFADWIWVSAEDDDGNPVSVMVPSHAAGVVRNDDWDGFGQRLTGSGTTRFTAVELQAADVSPDRDGPTPITAFLQLVLLASLVGTGRAALRDAVAFVRGRTRVYSHGLADTAVDDPLVQRVVGRIAGLVYAAEATVLYAAATLAETHDEVAGRGHRVEGGAAASAVDLVDGIERAERAAVSAQLTVTETVLMATSTLFEVGGASATSSPRELDRHWRNARVIASHNPVTYQERIIGSALLTGSAMQYTWQTGEART